MRIGLTSDFLDGDGKIAIAEAERARLEDGLGVEIGTIPGRRSNAPLEAQDVASFDALITKRNRLSRDLLEHHDLRLKHVARSGVGFDHIDIEACNKAGVLVTITPDAVRRPVASSILALILALAHRLFERDRLARKGDWTTRAAYEGVGLEGKVLGLIGAGNIGFELLRLIAPFGMRTVISDPVRRREEVSPYGAELVTIEELMRGSDFIVLACPLNEMTRRIINNERLSMMKRSAFLVNMARGELIEEPALIEALANNRIAGAGIDVFEQEPTSEDNPLFGLSNVILGQHNFAHTDEVKRIGDTSVVSAVLDVLNGRMPHHAVNPEAWPKVEKRIGRVG